MHQVVVVFTAAENSGMNMGAILSGLGVGGIMLALSAQEMAKDAFASVTMMVDGAFDKGDGSLVRQGGFASGG